MLITIIITGRSAYTESCFQSMGMAFFSPQITPSRNSHTLSQTGDKSWNLLGISFIARWLSSCRSNSESPRVCWAALRKKHLPGKNAGKWKAALIHSPAAHRKWTLAFDDPNLVVGLTFLGSSQSVWAEWWWAQILKPTVWALSPAQLFTYGVTLGKLSHLSVPKRPHLENEVITVPTP